MSPSFCKNCNSVNIKHKTDVTISGNVRYTHDTCFCGDCGRILSTTTTSERVVHPKDPKTDRSW